jgi:hypothetical protein
LAEVVKTIRFRDWRLQILLISAVLRHDRMV